MQPDVMVLKMLRGLLWRVLDDRKLSSAEANSTTTYDSETGLPVITAGGTVHWHEGTKKWIAIFGGRVDDPTGTVSQTCESIDHRRPSVSMPSRLYTNAKAMLPNHFLQAWCGIVQLTARSGTQKQTHCQEEAVACFRTQQKWLPTTSPATHATIRCSMLSTRPNRVFISRAHSSIASRATR